MCAMELERALEKDGAEILEIIEQSPAKGAISLLYTRRPNPVTSFLTESKRSVVRVIRDDEGRIVYQGAVVVRDYHLRGRETPIGYVTGVRKRKESKGSLNWIHLAADSIPSYGAEGFLFSFLADNPAAERMITGALSRFCKPVLICDYTTFLLSPKALMGRGSRGRKGVSFRQMEEKDFSAVHRFLSEEGRRHDFFPVIKDLFSDCPGLGAEDCLLMLDDEGIAGFCALWHQEHYKQIIVKEYGAPYHYLRHLSFLPKLFRYIPFPEEGRVLSFPQLSLFLLRKDREDLRDELLGMAARKAYANKETMIVMGAPSDSALARESLQRVRNISFSSRLYYMSIRETGEITIQDPRPECAFL